MVIEVVGLSKTINGTKILCDVNLSVEKKSIIGITGRNGSGKSMLFKSIAGFVIPTQGNISVHGKQVGKDLDFPDDVGILIEDCGFIPNISGYENLKLLASISKKADEERIWEVLAIVGLDNEKKAVKKYSLGMKQRLAIAQALLENPSVLILDEPMNSLDKDGVDSMRKVFAGLKEEGKTLLLASHNPDDISILCDEVYEMDNGCLRKITV